MIQRDGSDIHSTVPRVSDPDKLLSQCLSQHAFTFVLKPFLSISLSPSVSADRSTPSLSSPHLFPLFFLPSVVHSMYSLSFLATFSLSFSLSLVLSLSFSSKMLLSNLSRGFRHTNSPNVSFFCFRCHFSISQILSRFLFTASLHPSSFCSSLLSRCPDVVMILSYNESCSWC